MHIVTLLAASLSLVVGVATRAGTPDAPPSAPGTPALIVIDGAFDDWEAIPPAVIDPPDNPAGPVDIGAIRVTDDPAFCDLAIDLGRSVNLQRLEGRLLLLVDADGDTTTGMRQYDLDGVDAIVVFTPPDTRKEGQPGRGVSVRLPGPEAEAVSPYDWGVQFAPTYAADRAEVRLLRGATLAGRGPLLIGDTATFRAVVLDRAGAVRDTTDPITHHFATRFASPDSGGQRGGDIDPIVRHGRSAACRLLSWNGELGALFTRAEHFARVLRALSPEIVAFQELTDASSAAQVESWLNEHVPGPTPWRCVFGEGGGDLRTAVAARIPISVVPGAERVRYVDTGGTEREVRATLAAVECAERTMLVVSIHLKCCGHAGSREDFQRLDEAEALRRAITTACGVRDIDGVVVCGDFNLVGTRHPLDRLLLATDIDGGDLAVVEAFQLDRRSNATWVDARQPFTPGRLDFLIYSDSTLDVINAFVFDSTDLDSASLDRHGLHVEDTALASDHLPLVADFSWRSTAERARRGDDREEMGADIGTAVTGKESTP